MLSVCVVMRMSNPPRRETIGIGQALAAVERRDLCHVLVSQPQLLRQQIALQVGEPGGRRKHGVTEL